MTDRLIDQGAEEAVLGACLLSAETVVRALVAEGTLAEHFGVELHREVFDALAALVDRGVAVDHVAVMAEMRRRGRSRHSDADAVRGLAEALPGTGAFRTHAAHLDDLFRRRRTRTAAQMLAKAAEAGDEQAMVAAEQQLSSPTAASTTHSPEQLAERALGRLAAKGAPRFPMPFARLTNLMDGGLRRGDYALLGGWTAHGKSVMVDQTLQHCALHGAKTHLYINEMTEAERVDRLICALSGLPFADIRNRRFGDDGYGLVIDALKRLPFGITEAHDWSAAEIARHIRWHDFDVVGVDILHNIAHREERDLAEISHVLNQAAKSASCAVLAAVHLNDNRVDSPRRPRPVLRDIRGSGMLSRHSDYVMFVWQEDDEDGRPTGPGVISLAKARQATLGAMGAQFNGSNMRWEPHQGRERG